MGNLLEADARRKKSPSCARMHKAEPYATGHDAESASCGWVSGEKTENKMAEGRRIHAPARVERKGSGERGKEILPISARIRLGRERSPKMPRA